jgi:L-alanine-DL-glutamate epimerase-like enolase superfamily enzyme
LAEKGLCDGVNIKVEKAGGFRGAILAAHEARSRKLGVWLGMMVSSILGTATTSHLLPLSTDPEASADLDGALLVQEEARGSEEEPGSVKFEGGFEWVKPEGNIRLYPNRPGLGLNLF